MHTLTPHRVVVVAGYGPATVVRQRDETIGRYQVAGYDLQLHCVANSRYWVAATQVAKRYQRGSMRDPVTLKKAGQGLELLLKNRTVSPFSSPQRYRSLQELASSNNFAKALTCLRETYTPHDQEWSITTLPIYEKLLEQVAAEVALIYGLPRQRTREAIESAMASRQLPAELQQQS